jgi:glucokinase
MDKSKILGIDLGATNIRGAVVTGAEMSAITSKRINSKGTVEDVLQDIYQVTDQLLQSDQVNAIGIGVPSVVDIAEGIVYDVQYIPSWKEVHLKALMEQRYQVPVYVNNDANCFVAGEYYYGKGKGVNSIIGLTLGTGLGTGIMINGRVYAGTNCGAGEIGLFPYLDQILEYYCSGSFFQNVYGIDGGQVFADAQKGDENAIALFSEIGVHIGHAIKQVMSAYDPQLIILGGSLSQAYSLFHETMWKEMQTFAYGNALKRIKIEVSDLPNSAIFGAAALYYDTL